MATKKTSAKKATGKEAAGKRISAGESAARKSVAKKTIAAKKRPATKSPLKKSAAKKSAAKKSVARKSVATASKPTPRSMPKAGRDPKGGLTAKGREYFNKKEGSHLRPGVQGPADTPEKMVRKGSFLRRHFAHPRGPMKNPKGEPTRLALSAHAWGEPVPQTTADAKRLAREGHELLEQYHEIKDGRASAKKTASTRKGAAKKSAGKRAGAKTTSSRQGAGTKAAARKRT